MKLYSPEVDYKVQKILTTSKIAKKDLCHQKIGFDAKLSKNFRQNYPQNCLPALQTQTGKYIFGVNSILFYLTYSQILKTNKTQIVQFLQKIEHNVDSATGILFMYNRVLKKQSPDKNDQLSQTHISKSKQILSQFGKQLNQKLCHSSYLVGQQMTIADISSYYHIRQFQNSLNHEEQKKQWQKMKNLRRWFEHMSTICY